MKRIIPNLIPGQDVAIANCVDGGVIKSRIGKNLYNVEYQGRIIEVSRNQLFVSWNGMSVDIKHKPRNS